MCIVGAPPAARLKLSPMDLLVAEKRMCGSVIGNRATISEMLDFAGRHNIGAVVEVVPLAQANAAIEKVRAGKARYRMVLQI
jgi:D-arabinose 1-dehydrogenase-like Zn-dependent alcohol dehydrogenase